MRLKFAPVALVALSAAFGTLWSLSTPAWAKDGKSKADKNSEVPANINQQFKWEENVVGPNDKKIDHDKIAAMQAAARKEDAKHKNDPTVKKAERPAGVGVPASSTLPTMDIEKPAPVAARTIKPRPAAKAPPPRDSLDQLLDSEKDSGGSHSDGGLGKVLAVSDRSSSSTGSSSSSSSHDSSSAKAKGNKHAHHAHQ